MEKDESMRHSQIITVTQWGLTSLNGMARAHVKGRVTKKALESAEAYARTLGASEEQIALAFGGTLTSLSSVPEPGTLLLMSLGLAAAWRKRKLRPNPGQLAHPQGRSSGHTL
jgi:hypothetical protein